MSDAIRLVLFNGVVAVIGAAVVLLAGTPRRRRWLPTVLGLAPAAGLAACGIVATVGAMVGIDVTPLATVLLAAAGLLVIRVVVRGRTTGLAELEPPRSGAIGRALEVACLVLVAVLSVRIVRFGAATGLDVWDGWAMWGPKAHALFVEGDIWGLVFTDQAYGMQRQEYPVLLPALEALAAGAIGRFDQPLADIEASVALVAFGWGAVGTPACRGHAGGRRRDRARADGIRAADRERRGRICRYRRRHVHGPRAPLPRRLAREELRRDARGRGPLPLGGGVDEERRAAVRPGRGGNCRGRGAGLRPVAPVGSVPRYGRVRRTRRVDGRRPAQRARFRERAHGRPGGPEILGARGGPYPDGGREAGGRDRRRMDGGLAPGAVRDRGSAGRAALGGRRSSWCALAFSALVGVYFATTAPIDWHLATSADRVVFSIALGAATVSRLLVARVWEPSRRRAGATRAGVADEAPAGSGGVPARLPGRAR